MKQLLFLILPLPVLSQAKKDTTPFTGVPVRHDTIRVSLLLTRKKMTIAHNYEGHAVVTNGRVVEFLDDRKKRFKAQVTVWDYRLLKNK